MKKIKIMTIVLAIVMVAMMFVMVGCGNTSGNNKEGSINDDNDSVITNDKNNTGEVSKKYIPDTKNLIGIAVYRVAAGEKYPYRQGQKLTNFDDWKFFYVDVNSDPANVVFDDNVVDRSIKYVDDNIVVKCSYKTNDTIYWGYIYKENTDMYLLATQDCISESSSWSVDGLGSITLILSRPEYEEPTHYRYVFQIDDVLNPETGYYVGRTVYSSDTYTIENLPTEITFKNDPWVNFVAIEMISSTGETIGTRKIAYYEDVPYVGEQGVVKMLDLFDDGESYQHVVTVNKEK